MFALIKREIEDNVVYYLGLVALEAIIISIMFATVYSDSKFRTSFPVGVPLLIGIGALALCAMGVTQMYADKTRGISSYLATLATKRSHIFMAKVIAALLAVMLFLVPMLITSRLLMDSIVPPVPFFLEVFFEVWVGIFLVCISCYCLGFQAGWTSGKVIPTLGSLFLVFVLFGLIAIKGFGVDFMVLLILFVVASLVRTWHSFKSTAL